MDVRVGLWRKPKNWCFWTVVLEKTHKSLLDCKEIKPVNPKRNQSWIFIWRTNAEPETPILWPPDVKNWLIRKDSNAEKERRQEKGMTEDEMVGWHHWLDGHKFEQAPGVGDGQRSLVCCSPWGCKESDMTERLNWTELKKTKIMASSPITSWQIDGETMETVTYFLFGGSKITTGSDCNHEIKRHLLLGRKAMTNLDSILKTRDITLANKGPSSQKLWFFQ